MRISVVVFPGTNCDHDIEHMYQTVLKQTVNSIWHQERDLKNPDLVVLPGGFAHGDYLRTGAMAKLSPVMEEVAKFAKRGGPVLGVCNGFQILCEAGLLPGVLLPNACRRFLSQFVHVAIESDRTPFTRSCKGKIFTAPIAHFEGNYFAEPETIKRLEDREQVIFRYCSPEGSIDATNSLWSPNGAINAIAGVCNERGNVVGLMPHPERSAESLVGAIGGDSGRAIFDASLLAA